MYSIIHHKYHYQEYKSSMLRKLYNCIHIFNHKSLSLYIKRPKTIHIDYAILSWDEFNYLKHIVVITCVYLLSTRGSTQISVNTRFYKNLIICQNISVKLTPSLTRLLIILIEIILIASVYMYL